jgi:hypothetical protein
MLDFGPGKRHRVVELNVRQRHVHVAQVPLPVCPNGAVV